MRDEQNIESSESENQRVIRVFISSTFRDMQAERDYLVKFTFPQLRRLCESRGVTWGEVDLRWGVTDEQSAEGKVLPICLEEIKRCRPYFIGLLGERYGWVPDSIPPELLEAEPWLKEQLDERKSVTELEILHGVLRNPDMSGHAYFYFRDSAYVDTVAADKKKDFTSESADDAKKLAQLKENIRKSGFPAQENYPTPEALGALILKDMTAVIDRLYPEGSHPDPLDQEAMEHAAYARSREKVYIGRDEYFDRLDEHAGERGEQPLVILGESGSGKSALLANWASRYLQTHPEALVLQHYIGATPYSADWVAMLRRIMGEFKRKLSITEEIPSKPEELRDAFPAWLVMAAAQKRVILIIDALNQLEDNDGAPDLRWLPTVTPSNMRLFVSTLPGRSFAAINLRDWPVFTVEPLDVKEREKLINADLQRHSKKLEQARVKLIATATQTANPLFLRVLLSELCVWGVYEQLDERIRYYLKAQNPYELYRKVIIRWEEDYEGDSDLVGDTLSVIWASRRGISETELRGILGNEDGPLPRAKWSPLYLAMADGLVSRNGLLTFAHDYLRTAARDAYIPEEDHQRKAHFRLADYFWQQETNPRRADELPWQLWKAEERDYLRDCLLDIDMFLLKQARDQNELLRYWVWLNEERSLGQPYTKSFVKWAQGKGETTEVSFAAKMLAHFFLEAALYEYAEPLIRQTLKNDELSYGENHPAVANGLSNLAQVLQATNRLEEAESLMRRALKIGEQSYGENHPGVALHLNNLAQVLLKTDRHIEAEALMRRGLKITEQSYGENHPDVAVHLNNLAQVLQATNRLDEAEPLMRSALKISEQCYGENHPGVAIRLNNLAGLLYVTNRRAEAEALMRRALKIVEQTYGENHPAVANGLNNLAQMLQATNRLDEAELLMRRALKIDEQSYGENHPDVAIRLNNLAGLLYDTNRLAEAEPLMRRALNIFERSHGKNHSDVAGTLNKLAELLVSTGRYTEAEPLMRRSLKINEQCYGENHPLVAANLQNLTKLLWTTNRHAEADLLIGRALKIFEQSYGENHPSVAICLNDLALMLQATNRQDEAELLMRRALKIDEQCYGENHPHVASKLGNLALLLKQSKRFSEAEPLMRRALKIDEQSYGENHPSVAICLNNLAMLLYDTNRLAEAEPLMRRALKISKQSYGENHPDVAIRFNNLAQLFQATNRLSEAEQLMRCSLKIDEQNYGENHPDVARGLNNLAQLLKGANRHAEAEPLMRRGVDILLCYTRTTGHPHPNLQDSISNYGSLLMAMGRSQEEVIATIRQMAPEFFTQQAQAAASRQEIESKLNALFKELHANPGKVNEILGRVRTEDPLLFQIASQFFQQG
jgi:nephrocystin-3